MAVQAATRWAIGGAALWLLAGCVPPGLFDFEVSDEAARAGWPSLYTGAAPIEVLPADADRSAELLEASQTLEARAAALRARAARMSGSVLGVNDPAKQAFGG